MEYVTVSIYGKSGARVVGYAVKCIATDELVQKFLNKDLGYNWRYAKQLAFNLENKLNNPR